MRTHRALVHRSVVRWGLAAVVVGSAVLAACSSDDSPSAGTTGDLPSAAQEIVDSAPFVHGSWSYDVVDADSGERLYANQQDTINFLGSTTKLFTVGTYFDQVGTDATLETPVYATGDRSGGDLRGDLVLVGSGDFILGSRDAGTTGAGLQWKEPDHVYYYASPTVERVAADPLTGLDELAAQVKAAGITTVSGDVLVDDRLWEPYESKEGVVTPIMVNDNVLDLQLTPGAAVGDRANLDVRPRTAYFTVVNEVVTTAAGSSSDVTATVDADDRVVVTGELALDAEPYNTGVFAPDPAAYARASFIEALGRAGVTVTAPLAGATASLPAAGSYDAASKVASLTSPPASVLGKLVLKVSHNRGAETLMCLLAVRAGSTDCNDGLTTMLETIGEAGLDQKAVFIYDGEGSDPASATPSSLVGWLTWAEDQSWGDAFRDGLPDLTKDGNILVKSGTSARPQIPPMPSLFVVHGEAGYMTTASGRRLIVTVYANNGSFPTVAEGLDGDLVATRDWLSAVQQAN